jgi:long-chain fatty acid transport protein
VKGRNGQKGPAQQARVGNAGTAPERRPVSRGVWAVLVAVALAGTSGEVLAGGFHNPDFGVRRLGMLAVVARPDDGSAIFHNPAGMTLLEGTHFYHHQSWFVVESGFRLYDSEGTLRPRHNIEPDWNIGAIPFIGVTSDLGLERLRFGFGIYAPNAYGAALPDDEPSRYHITDAVFIGSRATLSAAWEATDQFSLGGGISLIHVYLSASRVMNPLVLQDPDARFLPPSQTAPQDAVLDIDGTDWTVGWNLGVLFKPLETFRFGFVFESGSPVALEGDVNLTLANGAVQTVQHRTELVIPLTLRAGFNWEFAPDFELGMDLFWWHYQVLQEQRTELTSPILGLNELVEPKNYTNSWNWCAGVLYHLTSELELMFGYQWDFTPIPERTLTLENPSRTQTGVSTGLRWQVSDDVRLGVAYVHNWFRLFDVQDSVTVPPTNGKGFGAGNELGLDVLWSL